MKFFAYVFHTFAIDSKIIITDPGCGPEMDNVAIAVKTTVQVIGKTKYSAAEYGVDTMIIRFYDLAAHVNKDLLQNLPGLFG